MTRPHCSCHDHPMTRQRKPDGSDRWRCNVEHDRRRKVKMPSKDSADGEAIECLRYQRPELDDAGLLAELKRQRMLASSGALAPAGQA